MDKKYTPAEWFKASLPDNEPIQFKDEIINGYRVKTTDKKQ